MLNGTSTSLLNCAGATISGGAPLTMHVGDRGSIISTQPTSLDIVRGVGTSVEVSGRDVLAVHQGVTEILTSSFDPACKQDPSGCVLLRVTVDP